MTREKTKSWKPAWEYILDYPESRL